MQKYKLIKVTPEDKTRMDRERIPSDRILLLLQLIRLSKAVSDAGAQYRKSR